jgi:hypothetical protein
MSNTAEADQLIELLRTHTELIEKIRIQAEWVKRISTLTVTLDACREVEYYVLSIQDLSEIGQLEDLINRINDNKEP